MNAHVVERGLHALLSQVCIEEGLGLIAALFEIEHATKHHSVGEGVLDSLLFGLGGHSGLRGFGDGRDDRGQLGHDRVDVVHAEALTGQTERPVVVESGALSHLVAELDERLEIGANDAHAVLDEGRHERITFGLGESVSILACAAPAAVQGDAGLAVGAHPRGLDPIELVQLAQEPGLFLLLVIRPAARDELVSPVAIGFGLDLRVLALAGVVHGGLEEARTEEGRARILCGYLSLSGFSVSDVSCRVPVCFREVGHDSRVAFIHLRHGVFASSTARDECSQQDQRGRGPSHRGTPFADFIIRARK